MYDRQPITTTDGGTVALDWFQPRGYAKLPTDTPVVLVLHGLTGASCNCHKVWARCGDIHSALHGRVVFDIQVFPHLVIESAADV